MRCTEIVIQDHVVLRRALDILDAMVGKMEAGERIEIADALTILKFIRSFGVEYHQTMEEKILFPALLRLLPQEGPIPHIMFEHTELGAFVVEAETALRSRKGVEFAGKSRGLTMLFRSHFDREDTVLRSLSEPGLSEDQDISLAAELTRLGKPPEKFANLQSLEWKYVPRPLSTPLGGQSMARARGSHAS